MALSGDKRMLVIGGAALCCVGVAVLLWQQGSSDVSKGSDEDRVSAAARVASERPANARQSLAEAAEDPNPKVRMAAIVGLTQMMEPQDRPIIEKAVEDADAGVRAVAAETLGEFNDPQAAEKLKTIAQSPREDLTVRKAALRGLVPCDDPRAVVAMLEIASDESVPNEIRLQAGKSVMRKAGGKLMPDRRPENKVLWNDLIQRLKNDQRIRRAYSAAGEQLVDRPDDLAERSVHGSRDLPSTPGQKMAPGRLVDKKEKVQP